MKKDDMKRVMQYPEVEVCLQDRVLCYIRGARLFYAWVA